ncbi:MAG TPA: hypothetical protein VK638_04250 [Edaphobacter sp.]|nr:hypothetical protein [Edaphobacter sp.]
MADQVSKLQASVNETHALATAAQRAVDTNIRLAVEDRRPWVGLQSLQCKGCRLEPDGSLSIGILAAELVNTGKTPAVDMIISLDYMSLRASEPVPTYEDSRKQAKAARMRMDAVPFRTRPEFADEIRKTQLAWEKVITPSSEVLAPNASRPVTIISGLKQGRNRMSSIADRNVVYGLGEATYYDTSRAIQHKTTFCVLNLFGIEFQYCSIGNEMN